MSIPLSNISLTASEIIENSSLSSALRMNTETVEGVEFTEVGTPDDLYYKLNSLTITDYSGKNRTGNLVNAVLQQTNPIDLNGYSLYFNNAYVYSNSFFLNSISKYKGNTIDICIKCNKQTYNQTIFHYGNFWLYRQASNSDNLVFNFYNGTSYTDFVINDFFVDFNIFVFKFYPVFN